MQATALFLAFYMLIGGCIPRSDFSQLAHLGELKAHFVEHQEEAQAAGKTITFFEFLYIHFIDTNQHTETHHEEDHQQLPLQTLNGAVSFIVVTLSFLSWSPDPFILLPNTSYQNPFYLNGFLKAYLQPPSF